MPEFFWIDIGGHANNNKWNYVLICYIIRNINSNDKHSQKATSWISTFTNEQTMSVQVNCMTSTPRQ